MMESTSSKVFFIFTTVMSKKALGVNPWQGMLMILIRIYFTKIKT